MRRLKQYAKSGKFWLYILCCILGFTLLALLLWKVFSLNIIRPSLFTGFTIALLTLPMVDFDAKNIREFARVRRWTYLGNSIISKDESFLDINQSKLFGKLGTKILEGIVHGNINDISLKLFRYTLEYKALRGNGPYQFTTLVVTLPHALPAFMIDSYAVHDFKDFVDLEGTEKIRLEGKFGDTYSIRSKKSIDNENRLLALSVITPDFMEIFDRYFQNCNLICEGRHIVIITPEDLYSENRLDHITEGLLLLIPKIERQIELRKRVGRLHNEVIEHPAANDEQIAGDTD